jgi:hypothetical protein
MSGGSLDYFYCALKDHVGDFRDKELDDLVSDLAQLFHDREWYLSGDTGAGKWNEARDTFKKKWFSESARRERIEKYLADFTEEIRQSFGISERYCENCAHWTRDKNATKYGDCSEEKRCRFHEKDTCGKWEKREATNGNRH